MKKQEKDVMLCVFQVHRRERTLMRRVKNDDKEDFDLAADKP